MSFKTRKYFCLMQKENWRMQKEKWRMQEEKWRMQKENLSLAADLTIQAYRARHLSMLFKLQSTE